MADWIAPRRASINLALSIPESALPRVCAFCAEVTDPYASLFGTSAERALERWQAAAQKALTLRESRSTHARAVEITKRLGSTPATWVHIVRTTVDDCDGAFSSMVWDLTLVCLPKVRL